MKLIYCFIVTCFFTACSTRQATNFIVKGTLKNSSAKWVYLEEDVAGSPQPVVVDSAILGKDGSFKLQSMTKEQTLYSLRAEKEDYTTTEKTATLSEECKNELNLGFEKALCKVAVGDDLGKCFGIKWIYFDFDKSIIREEAALDLAKILDVMTQYPNMKIDIRSHTDSRGTSKYNEGLSGRRAKATKDWLIKNGIPANKLSSKGYGETQLVNQCSDGVKCTEEEHQQNRRSEFIIMAL